MDVETKNRKLRTDIKGDRRGIAAVAFIILFGLDIIMIFLSHRRAFLTDATTLLLLIVAGISMAFILSVIFGPLMGWCARLVERISERVTNPMIGVITNTFLLMGTGILVANSRSGQLFQPAPVWHDVAVLLPGGLYFLGARLHFRRYGAPSLFSGYSAASALAVIVVLAVHGEEFLKGRFGFISEKGMVSALAVLGIVTATVCFFHGMATMVSISLSKTQKGLIAGFLWVMLGVLQAVNGYFYVDLYYVFHVLLSLFSVLMAIQLAKGIVERFPFRLRALPRWMTAALLLVGLCLVIFVARPKSVTAYIGGIHTVNYRAVLEPFYRFEQTVEDAREFAFFIYRKVLKRKDVPFFISPAERLPAGFEDFTVSNTSQRPDIDGLILIILDAKRPRDLGVYPESDLTNPRLKTFFSDAFVFENNFSVANRTKRSLPALYTGAHWQSVLYNTWMDHPSFWHRYQTGNGLGHVFEKAGFDTIVLSNAHYYENYFIEKKMSPVFGGFGKIYNEAAEGKSKTGRLIRAFKQRPDEVIPPSGKFATVVHLYDHRPRLTDEMDEMIGLLCESLVAKNRWNRTVVAITADHGTQHREHGRTSYGRTLFNEEIRVPYILRVPGMRGRRIEAPVASIDHFPTFLDLFGIPADIKMEGKTYFPLLNGSASASRQPIFIKSHSESSAVIDGNLKLIKWFTRGPFALFDMKADPGELTNLVNAPDYRNDFARLKRLLESFEVDHPAY
jgi:arylsulfatase A-like enzyme